MKFRKKPVVIEAIQFTGDNWKEIGEFCGLKAEIAKLNRVDILLIKSLEGDHRANANDWIIKGVQGEFYACKPDIFKQTYDELTQ